MSKTSELDWLLERAKCERDALLVLGLANDDLKYEIGEISGYSPGNFRTENQRRKNLSAAVSRSANSPRIQNLLIEFLEWRTNSTLDIAPSEEILKRLTVIARSGAGPTQLAALKYLDDCHRKRNQMWRENKASPADMVNACFKRRNVFWDAIGLSLGQKWSGPNWRPPTHLQKLADLIEKFAAADYNQTLEMMNTIVRRVHESDQDEGRGSAQAGASVVVGFARSGGSPADIDRPADSLHERRRTAVIAGGGEQ